LWAQPTHFKYNARSPKKALADATADLVPSAIRARHKQGFTLPFSRWLRAELRPFLHETFSPASLAACPWLDPITTAQVWTDYQKQKDDRAWSRVWTLAVLINFANRRSTP
jgi:asparagine synthase (glutamine-hydrolysing)